MMYSGQYTQSRALLLSHALPACLHTHQLPLPPSSISIYFILRRNLTVSILVLLLYRFINMHIASLNFFVSSSRKEKLLGVYGDTGETDQIRFNLSGVGHDTGDVNIQLDMTR